MHVKTDLDATSRTTCLMLIAFGRTLKGNSHFSCCEITLFVRLSVPVHTYYISLCPSRKLLSYVINLEFFFKSYQWSLSQCNRRNHFIKGVLVFNIVPYWVSVAGCQGSSQKVITFLQQIGYIGNTYKLIKKHL